MLTEELPIHKDTVEYIKMVINIGVNFPKKYKYTVYDKFLSTILELPELLEEANRAIGNPQRRQRYIIAFSTKFNASKVFIRIMNEVKLITVKQAANLAVLTSRIGKQTTGWLKAFQNVNIHLPDFGG